MDGKGSEEDYKTFEPVNKLASELNDTDLLILSTPLWNMALPYVMKQYIDIVIQPGMYLLILMKFKLVHTFCRFYHIFKATLVSPNHTGSKWS